MVHEAIQTFGSRYAGAWIDWKGTASSPAPVTRIMVAGAENLATETLFRSRLAVGLGPKTEVSYVKYTAAELNAYKKSIVDYASSHFNTPSYRPSGEMAFFIDTPDNAVGIALTHEDARFLAQLQRLVPADALRIEWISVVPRPAPSPQPASLQPAGGPGWVPGVQRFHPGPIYKGGYYSQTYLVYRDYADCTSAFTLRGPFYNKYKYYGITAGHCAPPMSQIISGHGVHLGIGTRVWSYGTGGDYYAYVLESNYQSSYKAKGTIIAETHNGFGFIDNVVGRVSNKYQIYGLPVCASGYTTNRVTCSTIRMGSGTWVFNGLTAIGNLACSTYTDRKGDSGGAVYIPAPGNRGYAAGVIDSRASVAYDPTPKNNWWSGWSCYTTIDSVLQGITAHNSGVPAYVVDANGQFS